MSAASIVAFAVSLVLAAGASAAAPAAPAARREDGAVGAAPARAEGPPDPGRRSLAGAPLSADARLGAGLGIGLAGGLALGTGIGLVLRHRRVYPVLVPAPHNADYVAAVGATNVGSAMIGGGLGLGATALTAGLGARDRALWSEFAAGGVLAIAGVAWYVTEWQRVQRMLYDGGKEGAVIDTAALRRETAAASFIGAGIGLAFGAGVALLTRHLIARRSLRPGRLAGGGGPFGAGLLARF